MVSFDTLPLGAYQTNCYILKNEGKALVIDPGYEPETVLAHLRRENLTLEAILLTHGHFDHVGAVKELAAQADCRVYIHPAENTMPSMMTAGTLYYTHTYGEGNVLKLAGLTIRVLSTPGHTPGSVCLLCQNVLFSGDTLFAGSCGRTDLPGGDWATIRESLRRLAGIEADLTVCPGHGEATTLSREKATNPYLI